MAPPVTGSATEEFQELLRASRWSEAVKLYERGLTSEEKRQAEHRLPYAIALIRSGREASGIKLLTDDCLALPTARADLRRFVVPHLIQQGALERAAAVLGLLIDADPDSVEDRRLGGSVLGRLKRWDKAIANARRVIDLRPDDLPGHTSYLQLLLQSGRVEEAGVHARSLGDRVAGLPRLGSIALLALTRSGQFDAAADVASAFDESWITDETLAGAIVRAFFEAGKVDEAIEAGERLLNEGLDPPVLRAFLGQAYMASFLDDRYDRAIAHLREGLEIEPDDFRMNAAMGEALLRGRSYLEAIPYLAKACELQPKVPQARALFARALKQAGRYADAAREFRRLLEAQPSSPRWHRYAAGALSQAGQRKEAAALFDAFVAGRRATLPKNFEKGLDALWYRVDSVDLPKARLDWAWRLRSSDQTMDREQWERAAKWGHLADHYLLDWLECRDDRVHDAMMRLADLSEAERVLAGIDRTKGLILASAHIGPMYAGPLALELLGVRSRWLASTPSVARTAYAKSLISTSDQDDMQVARSFMISLRQGFAVVIALDGAINLAAPRIAFEGQEMTYSSFAARTAHRLEVPSVFCAPRWEGGKIGFVLEQMPDPLPDEDAESHAERWRDAFLAALRRFLSGPPENLRLSGGLWRHIR